MKRTVIISAVTALVVGVVSFSAYSKIVTKEHEMVMAQRKNCEYLGRIFGTDDVIVVECSGKVELFRADDIEDTE